VPQELKKEESEEGFVSASEETAHNPVPSIPKPSSRNQVGGRGGRPSAIVRAGQDIGHSAQYEFNESEGNRRVTFVYKRKSPSLPNKFKNNNLLSR